MDSTKNSTSEDVYIDTNYDEIDGATDKNCSVVELSDGKDGQTLEGYKSGNNIEDNLKKLEEIKEKNCLCENSESKENEMSLTSDNKIVASLEDQQTTEQNHCKNINLAEVPYETDRTATETNNEPTDEGYPVNTKTDHTATETIMTNNEPTDEGYPVYTKTDHIATETITTNDEPIDEVCPVITKRDQTATETITIKDEPADEGYPVITPTDPLLYRIKVEHESEMEDDTSSDSSTTSSSSESEEEHENIEKEARSRKSSTTSQNDKQVTVSKEDIRTKGEVFPEELPPLEELTITVDESVNLVHIGDVTSVVGILVVVQSNQNMPPLNEETVLFLEGRVSCGKIFEVFGPVASPWYSLRFNSKEDITTKGVTIGTKVFCAPKVDKYTNFVFVEHLKQIKGSDASWEDNNEPPVKFVEYSDDEEEKRAKAKLRNKKSESTEGDQIPGAKNVRRKKFKHPNETNSEQKRSNNQHEVHRQQGPRKFAPFGGNHNKFEPRGHPNQKYPRFSQPPWNHGNNQNPNSFGNPWNGGGNIGNMNNFPTEPYVYNPHQAVYGLNNQMVQTDFSKPPPNFNSNMNWYGGGNVGNQNMYRSPGSNCSSNHTAGVNQQNWQDQDNIKQPAFNPGGNSNENFNSMNSEQTGQNFRDASDISNRVGNFSSQNMFNSVNNSNGIVPEQKNNFNMNSPCGPQLNTGQFQSNGSIIDSRFIQNVDYNRPPPPPPQIRHPSPFPSNQPRFGGQPQFNRINRPF